MKTNTNGRFSCVQTVALMALVLGLAACGKKELPPMELPPVPVQVQTALSETVPLYVDSIGQTTAYKAVSIQPQVSGKLMKIHFTQGAMVKKGDLLFSIDDAPYQAALAAAKAQLEKDQASLEINQKQVERSKALLPDKYVSQQTFDEYQANVSVYKAAVAADKANIASAQINLDYCRITAPVDGMVGTYLVNEGNIVQAANPAVLTTIRRMDPLYVDFVVPAHQFTRVREYLEKSKDGTLNVQVTELKSSASEKPRARVAKLKILGNQVARSSGTVNLRAEMDNKDLLFWPNEQVSVRLILAEIPDEVLVPGVSVRYNQQGSFVWVIKDNVAEQKIVELGQLQKDGQFYGIKSGVEANSQVVTDGAIMLRPGSKVAVIDPKAKQQQAAQKTPEEKPAENSAH